MTFENVILGWGWGWVLDLVTLNSDEKASEQRTAAPSSAKIGIHKVDPFPRLAFPPWCCRFCTGGAKQNLSMIRKIGRVQLHSNLAESLNDNWVIGIILPESTQKKV